MVNPHSEKFSWNILLCLWLLLFSVPATATEDIWAEAQISETQPYVQQTLIYMVLVVSRVGLSIVDPIPPVIPGVSLERLDEQPLNYPVTFKGKRYQVTAFRYALTPLTLGRIDIPPAKLKITYASQQWGGLQPQGKQGELSSNKLSLDSRPPATAQQPWLPLYSLRFNGKLDKGLVARVGEPLTLTLSLNAVGAAGGQLPSLAPLLEELADFKVYPERPQTSQEVISDENLLFLSGKRVENFTLIPQRSGQLHLPALRLNWWNVKENKEMTVEWAGQTVAVVESGAPAPTADSPAPRGEVTLGTGLPLLWQLAINIVIFLLGLWVGAGHPGSERARAFLRQAWQAAQPLWRQCKSGLGDWLRVLTLADLRQRATARIRANKGHWLAGRQTPASPLEQLRARGNHLLPARFKALGLMRAIDAAETPARIYQALCLFAHERLGSPTHLPLRGLGGVYCRAYPSLERESVENLFAEIDQAMYAGKTDWDIYAWKERFDELFGGLPFRSPRLAVVVKETRSLPELNPV